MRAQGEPHDVPEPEITAQDGEAVSCSVRKDVVVGPTAKAMITNVFCGESGGCKRGRKGSWEVFIDQEPGHLRDCSDLLHGQRMGGIRQRGEDIVACETVLLGGRLRCHTSGELTEHDVDGHARAFDHRLAKAHALVNHDSWSELDQPSSPLLGSPALRWPAVPW